jgi:uncharacterized protein
MAQFTRQIFVNLPVADLKKSVDFFTLLGFELDPKFTNDQGACMIINADAYVMLLAAPFFETFTKKQLCDTSLQTEAICALSSPSRAGVNELVEKALAAGGKRALDPQDHGFMYGWSFYDLDGHHWEVLWMDPAAGN